MQLITSKLFNQNLSIVDPTLFFSFVIAPMMLITIDLFWKQYFFIKRQMSDTSSDNERYDEWKQMTTSEWYNEWNDNEWYNKWKRVVQKVTTSDSE